MELLGDCEQGIVGVSWRVEHLPVRACERVGFVSLPGVSVVVAVAVSVVLCKWFGLGWWCLRGACQVYCGARAVVVPTW